MLRVVLTIGLVVFGVSIIGALLAGNKSETQTPQPIAATTSPSPQLVGMSINVWHTPDEQLYFDAIDSIAGLGCNYVQIVTPVFQKNGASETIEVIPGKSAKATLLVRLMQHARQNNLRVGLMMQVNFTDPRGNEWRGKIQPERWSPWWTSYNRVLDEYIDLAAKARADVFVVGCELLTTQTPEHLPQWEQIITRCRERLDGRLTYSTNWDAYTRVTFWNKLNFIGISGYWNVAKGAADPAHPTMPELQKRWATIRDDIVDYAAEQGRPALLTELGYPALPWALKDPWNYIPGEAEPDPAAQGLGYEAFIEAWQGVVVPGAVSSDTHVAGVVFYKWDIWDEPTGYGIAGRPAEQALRTWLSDSR